jgi:hypothetical protein
MTNPQPIRNEAFPLWLDLVGVDRAHFDARAKEFEGGSKTIGEWDSIRTSLAIHECFGIPDDELTAQLMLGRALNEYASDIPLTLATLLNEPDTIQRQLTLARGIRAVLDREEVMMQRAGFAATLASALKHYGAQDREDIQEVLEDDEILAQLRRDSYFGTDTLRMHQFLEGEAGTGGRPGYNIRIRRWWNMKDLLAAHAYLPEGVSLNVVQPALDHEIFFCFAVRRGGNLYLLHDAAENAHPLQGFMTRRKDRALGRRMAKFWFPYEMAGVVLSEDGREANMKSEKSTALDLPNRFSNRCTIMAHVSDLPPCELLWTIMMFDRIMDRFWSELTPLPSLPLSYAAGHLRSDSISLLEDARTAGLPVVAGVVASLALPALERTQVENLHSLPEGEKALGEMASLHDKQWMADRYGPQVPEASFNLISSGETDQLARLTHQGQLEVLEKPDHDKIETDRFFGRSQAMTDLHQLDRAHFGTAEELQADRQFIARHNYASSISALAHQEYSQRHDDVRKWLSDRYEKRKDFLLTLAGAASRNELVIHDWTEEQAPEYYSIEAKQFKGMSLGDIDSTKRTKKQKTPAHVHSLGLIEPIKGENSHYQASAFIPLFPGSFPERGSTTKCLATGAAASYWLAIRPCNAVELAWLLGVEREELPDVLRNHGAMSSPHGNSILNRIDPMLSRLDNPWHKLELGIRLPLSKRGLAQLEKAATPVDLGPLQSATIKLYTGEEPSLDVGLPTLNAVAPKARKLGR